MELVFKYVRGKNYGKWKIPLIIRRWDIGLLGLILWRRKFLIIVINLDSGCSVRNIQFSSDIIMTDSWRLVCRVETTSRHLQSQSNIPHFNFYLDQIWRPRKRGTPEREHSEWRRPRNTPTRTGSTATWGSRWCCTASCSLWWALPGYSSMFTSWSTLTTLTLRNTATTPWSSSSGPSAASIYCGEVSSSSSLSARIQSWTR